MKKIQDQSKSAQAKYKSDPEFRKKHLEYMKEKQRCECGKMVGRTNIAHHINTKAHKSYLIRKEYSVVDTLLEAKRDIYESDDVHALSNIISVIDNEVNFIVNCNFFKFI